MALQVADRVVETTTTTGTGALALAGNVTGFRAFSGVCSVSDTCYYMIEAIDGTGTATGDWEVGLGTYSGVNTLTRTTVLASSNAGSVVTLAAGTKRVMLSAIAAYLATLLPVFASSAEAKAGTVSTKVISPSTLFAIASPQTLTDGATINWDMSLGPNAKVTLGGNRTFAAPTNATLGASYALEVIQDGTGSRTGTWGAAFDWGSAGTPTLTIGAGKRDIVFLYCYDAATPSFRATINKAA